MKPKIYKKYYAMASYKMKLKHEIVATWKIININNNQWINTMYHQQQNKWYPLQRRLLAHFGATLF